MQNKIILSLNRQKGVQKHVYFFFKCSLIIRAPALQSEVSISNFVKFELQSMSLKIEQAFKKTNKIFIKIWPKRPSIRQLYGPKINVKSLTQGKTHCFCKNALLCILNNLPEPQSDSACAS